MNKKELFIILNKVKSGEMSSNKAADHIKKSILQEDQDVTIDISRKNRLGFQEIIYGKDKSCEQIKKIAKLYLSQNINFICTGLDKEKISYLQKIFPDFDFIPEAGFIRYPSQS